MKLSNVISEHGSRVVIEADHAYTADEISAKANMIGAVIQQCRHRQVLTRTLSTRDHLILLLAAERFQFNLYLAHPQLPLSVIDNLIEDHKITSVINNVDEIIREYGEKGKQPFIPDVWPAHQPEISANNVYIMTSGTTGKPKLASYPLTQLYAGIRHTKSSAFARWLLTYPSTGFAGLQVLLTAVIGGGVIVVMDSSPNAKNPDFWLDTAINHNVTHISGTPSFWRLFMQASAGHDKKPHLQQITIGGEAVDQTTLDRLKQAFPIANIKHIYASTETGVLFGVDDGKAGFPARWLEEGVSECLLRITDGILETKSVRAMTTYVSGHANPYTQDGWIRTGDLVTIENERVFFKGRKDSRINVAGYKVNPEEVESAILKIEGVIDVKVIAVTNPITGNALIAEIVCLQEVDADIMRSVLIDSLKYVLEPYKIPRIYRFVDAINLTDTGKKSRLG